jgi:hypothetical protein
VTERLASTFQDLRRTLRANRSTVLDEASDFASAELPRPDFLHATSMSQAGNGLTLASVMLTDCVVKVHLGPRDHLTVAGSFSSDSRAAESNASSILVRLNGSKVASAQALKVCVRSSPEVASGLDGMTSKVRAPIAAHMMRLLVRPRCAQSSTFPCNTSQKLTCRVHAAPM